MELLYVDNDRVTRRIVMLTVHTVRVLEKVVAVVKSCQAVGFGGVDQGFRFPLRMETAEKQDQYKYKYNRNKRDHIDYVFRYEISEAELRVLRNIIGKRGVDG